LLRCERGEVRKRLYDLADSIQTADESVEELHAASINNHRQHELGRDKQTIIYHKLHITLPFLLNPIAPILLPWLILVLKFMGTLLDGIYGLTIENHYIVLFSKQLSIDK